MPQELAALGILAGQDFHASGAVSTVPSGICDLAPTILYLLGIARPDRMTGRVLREVVRCESPGPAPSVQRAVFEDGRGDFRQALHRVQVDGTIYVEGGTTSG